MSDQLNSDTTLPAYRVFFVPQATVFTRLNASKWDILKRLSNFLTHAASFACCVTEFLFAFFFSDPIC